MVPQVTAAHLTLLFGAILWKTAEKVFDSLELPQYRAQSVAYAFSALAERSQRRIDLNVIWSEQRVLLMLVDAMKAVLASAHARTSPRRWATSARPRRRRSVGGVPGEGDRDWSGLTASGRFAVCRTSTERDAIAAEWEKLRILFLADNRTIEGLENYTGREWRTRRGAILSRTTSSPGELAQHRPAEPSWPRCSPSRRRTCRWRRKRGPVSPPRCEPGFSATTPCTLGLEPQTQASYSAVAGLEPSPRCAEARCGILRLDRLRILKHRSQT